MLIVTNVLLAVMAPPANTLSDRSSLLGAYRIVWFINCADPICTLPHSGLADCAARSARSTLIIFWFGRRFPSTVSAPPYLSDDIYSIVGRRVQAAGINPYSYIPADENLQSLRDEESNPKINRRITRTRSVSPRCGGHVFPHDAHKRIGDLDKTHHRRASN